MSVSPAQKRSKPPPVPEVPTVMLTPEFSPANASAAAEVSGATVEEPSIRMSPDTLAESPPEVSEPESSSPPQPAAASDPSAMAPAARMRANRRPRAMCWCSSLPQRGADGPAHNLRDANPAPGARG